MDCLTLFALLWLAVSIESAKHQKSVIVNTLSGSVEGSRQSSLEGEVGAFLGIPFAKPPKGKLRFRRPVPVERWCNVKDATKKPNSCTHYPVSFFGEEFRGELKWNPTSAISEDCLYLNVWSPTEHNHRRTSLAPVFVWIYGGGFNSGSSDLDLYDGALVAARNNIIVVSFNYRLGVFGFLDLQTDEAPGNVGLLDQQLALKWIKDNVIYFGGDPEKITIAGESAGSFSVNFHLLSPGSRNLFKRAIMQSGSAYLDKAALSTEKKFKAASKLAAAANCSHKDATLFPQQIAECLRKIPAEKLTLFDLGLYQVPVSYAFSPTVDGHFLPDHPVSMIEKGDFKKTDLLIGSNENEGTYFLVYDFASFFSKDNSSLLTKSQAISIAKTMFHGLGKNFALLIKHYFKGVKSDDNVSNRNIIGEMLGDAIFLCPTNRFAERMAESGEDVFYYNFMHRTKSNPWAPWQGVLHADEIEYMFGRVLVEKERFMKEEKELSEKMMDSWANFVRTGNPSLPQDEWPKYNKENRTYKILHGTKKGYGTGPEDKRCSFWNHMLPALKKDKYKSC